MLLFYIRHGEPIYVPDSLTEVGKAQAEALVERMKICKPEKIFSSSSNRAILTAKPTAEYFNIDIDVLDWCHENHVRREFKWVDKEGVERWCFQVKENIELFNSQEFFRLGDNWWQHPKFKDTPIKSGLDRIRKETDDFMESLGYIRSERGFIAKNPKYQRVALFAHHGFGVTFLSCLLDIPYPSFTTHFDMGYTGITVIHFDDEGFTVPKIFQLSNDSHLFADKNLKTIYNNEVEF